MKNKIEDLRNHLFATIEALQDPDKPMEIERAQAIADVAKVIVESAKTEVAFIKVVTDASGYAGVSGSGFIPLGEPEGPKPAARLVGGAR
ncbi:MAG: hypothetical protein WC700_02255 [Gemmatimonadaceae bacterium]